MLLTKDLDNCPKCECNQYGIQTLQGASRPVPPNGGNYTGMETAKKTPDNRHLQYDQIESLLGATGYDGAIRILDAFRHATTELLETLEKRLDSGDILQGIHEAHAVKGSAANIGGKHLAGTAGRIGTACRNNDSAGARAALKDARDDFTDFIHHFRAYIDHHRTMHRSALPLRCPSGIPVATKVGAHDNAETCHNG